MAEKTIDQKLKECKTVIIQNVEKGVQNAMIYRYMRDQKIDNDVKKYYLNTKNGVINLEFNDHEKAIQYYDRTNFKDKILIRPFNIYMNVTLADNEMKKYHFEGVQEDTMRAMFEMARKLGVCKIYTSYTNDSSAGKLKSSGILSFVRKDPITEQEFNTLKEELATIGVKINVYIPDKGLKCAVMLTNFYNGNLNDSEEVIEKNAKEQATNLIKQVLKDHTLISTVTPIVRRKELPVSEDRDAPKTETKVKALIEFHNYESGLVNFQQIRLGFINIPEARAVLNFYTSETNSFISLISSGLAKPEEMKDLTDKQFENELVNAFRKVNKNVIQVNIFPAGSNYVARVYMKSEQSGRDFIVDYDNFRKELVKFYRNPKSLKFNINVDDKTMKRIKQFESKATQIMRGIKSDVDKQKSNQRGAHNMPLNFGNNVNLPNFPLNGMMPMPNNMPNIGNIPNFPMAPGNTGFKGPQNFPMGIPQIPNQLPMNIGLPPMGMIKSPEVLNKEKIDKIFKERAHYVENCKKDSEFDNSFKKVIYPLVKFVLETELKLSATEAHTQTNTILQRNEIGPIIDFVKSPSQQNLVKLTKA